MCAAATLAHPCAACSLTRFALLHVSPPLSPLPTQEYTKLEQQGRAGRK